MIGLILAGGKGKRMKGNPVPKVLSLVNKRPMIERIVSQIKRMVEKIYVIVNEESFRLIECSLEKFQGIEYIFQKEQLGTGHAVQIAMAHIREMDDDVLICCGDMPLINSVILKNLIGKNGRFVICAFDTDSPFGYGRIIKNNKGQIRIVEERDCSEDEKKITLVNAGIYIFSLHILRKIVPLLTNDNGQNEFYLTDVVDLIQTHTDLECKVVRISKEDNYLLCGVNTLEDLYIINKIFEPDFILLQNHVIYDYDSLEDLARLLGYLTDCPFQFEKFVSTFQSIKKLFPNVQIYIAYHQLTGIYACGTLIIEPKFIHDCSPVGHIEDIVVLPGLHNEKIGSNLIHFLSERAFRDYHCGKVSLHCKPNNAEFYRKLGFVSDGHHFIKKPS